MIKPTPSHRRNIDSTAASLSFEVSLSAIIGSAPPPMTMMTLPIMHSPNTHTNAHLLYERVLARPSRVTHTHDLYLLAHRSYAAVLPCLFFSFSELLFYFRSQNTHTHTIWESSQNKNIASDQLHNMALKHTHTTLVVSVWVTFLQTTLPPPWLTSRKCQL